MPSKPTVPSAMAPPALVVHAVSRSDIGMRRSTNQDAVTIVPAGGPGGKNTPIQGDAFLMVADGMGAHAAGELASKIAVDTIPLAYAKSRGEAPPAALRQAIRLANDKIHQKGSSSSEFHGMGTTCSCLVLTQGAAIVGHVGDSRVYRLRHRVLEQLTFDHSLVWEMAAASKVSADRVPSCIPKNVITRSLGPHEAVMIDLEGPHELCEGDVFLLCSDGLTGVVDDPMAGSILSAMAPEAAAEALVNLANLRGGPDNISVIVARVEKAGDCCGASCHGGAAASDSLPPTGVALAIACTVAMLLSIYYSAFGMALLFAVGLGAALAYSLARRPEASPAALPPILGEALGNGPYRRTECGDHAAAAGDLRDLVRELSELRSEEDTVSSDGGPPEANGHSKEATYHLDWEPFKPAQESADAAFDRGDYLGAITQYADIIASAMTLVRGDDDTKRYAARDGILS
jgi:serine/threonine protein phosphatase PrpC